MRTTLLLLITLLVGCPHSGSRAPAQGSVEKRVVISSKRASGTFVTTTAPDGTITTSLFVLENGRGPQVDATVKLAADGTIASLRATGQHTMGTKVDETFAIEGGRASWKSLEEQGEAAAGAFFVPMSEIPAVDGWLVRAALAAGGTLKLLPAGEVEVETVGQLEVSANGEVRRLTGYALSGLDFTPRFTWMNEDGTWFGSFQSWFSIVPEGWEAAIDPILARQRELTAERDEALAAATAHRPPAAGLAYTHARVLDVERGVWLADQTVLVVGDRIAAVGAKVDVPAGAEVVDLAGKALVPGYVDMHSHLGGADGVLDIACGVTTVRDVGNDLDELDDLKQRWDTGAAVGPSIIRFGFIEGRGEKAASSPVTAMTEDEARAAVELYAARKYEGIKLYNSTPVELVPLLTRLAHEKGMLVTGHVPVHMLAHEAVNAGYDGIEHINMLFLNFFATHETDTRDTTRFTLVGEKAASFDLAGAEAKAFFALLREKQTVIDPTVAVFEDLLVGEAGKIIPGREELVARLPLQAAREYLAMGLPLDDGERATFRASFDQLLAMIAALHREGVHLVIGTDATGGIIYHHELVLYARAGVPNADILRMATLDAARAVKQEAVFGSIAAGKRADLVVLDGDPLADIRDADNVVATMRAGVVYLPGPLFESVGVRP
jgi:imidazolonepropionase-like amidohydrolase